MKEIGETMKPNMEGEMMTPQTGDAMEPEMEGETSTPPDGRRDGAQDGGRLTAGE